MGASWSQTPPAPVPSTPAGGYAGSQSCRACHERFYDLWSTSHHGLAMQPYTPELARQRLTPQPEPVAVGRVTYQAFPEKQVVIEKGPAGEKSYRIEHTMGGKNVFYFLTPTERGRLQVLPIAYDVNRRAWIDTSASAVRHFGDATADAPIEWTNPVYTFNTSCLGCHVSQLARNYDPATDTYRTKWGEPGINCETCHGPSAEHVRLARALPPGAPMPDPKLIVARKLTPEQTNATCGSCHAKLSPLTEHLPPGERFFDHFNLSTLEDPDFYPDGRDLGENFTMTTWRLSPCLKSGQIDCVDCHTSSGRYKFRQGNPNAACLPCHEKHVNNAAAHSHHPAESEGARCVACHMPKTEFGRMHRSDHSMRPPAPAATLAFKSPNACNMCHMDKDAAWADKHVREWRTRDYQAPILLRGGWIAAARKGDWSKLAEMIRYLGSKDREEIWSASLLRLLRSCDREEKWPAILACLTDSSPLVRAAAVEALGDRIRPDTLAPLLAAAGDEYRLVRTRAGAALSAVPLGSLPSADRRVAEAATQEYLRTLRARPDDSASRYNLGNFYLERQDYARAVEEFSAASRLQPLSLAPLANQALAYAATGDNPRAEASLRAALKLDPAHAGVNLNLGMLLAELGRLREAEQAFRTAAKSDPQSAAAAYNLGVLLCRDRPAEGIEWCRRAATLRPQDARYGYTLGFFLHQQGRTAEAVTALQAVIDRQPSSSEAYVLLASIHERANRWAEARTVYQRAVANPQIPEPERFQFLARERQLPLR
ncbi:MAG: tetratricopeptide repeat protein [Verrucomicrobia bacterium]|nr:tetratricopeptide repeat protein [Verrucomicrobiota bacterium]